MYNSPETQTNTEPTSNERVMVKERDTERNLGNTAFNNLSLDEYLEQADKAEEQKLIDGELFKVSAKKEQEITTLPLDGRTGLVVESVDDKGNRYLFVQQDAQKGLDKLSDILKDIPEKAIINRAFIVAPENDTNNGFSKDDEFLDHLTLVINYASLKRKQNDPIVQAVTYKTDPSPEDYNPATIKVNCLKGSETNVYVGDELIGPDY